MRRQPGAERNGVEIVARSAAPPPARSEIEDHVSGGPRAADEQAAGRGWVERLGVVAHRSRDEPALAVVADARAARPPDWHVAGFRELEQAPERWVPRDGEPAPGEGDERSRSRRSEGWVRSAGGSGRDPRRHRLAGPEHLGMDPAAGDAPPRKAAGQLAQERGRAAQVEVGIAGNPHLLELRRW